VLPGLSNAMASCGVTLCRFSLLPFYPALLGIGAVGLLGYGWRRQK
jgi:hypothetical protein